MSEYNNFHLFFPPNGEYRKRRINPAIDIALDAAVEELHFDFGALQDALGEKGHVCVDYFDFLKRIMEGTAGKDTDKEGEIQERIEAVNARLDKLLKPVYDKMKAQGFTEDELTR